MAAPPVTDPLTDEQLLRQIAEGCEQALSALFRRRRGEVYRFALHMTGARATAEDVTQEVFMAVMRDAGRYDATRATAVSWLCGMTRNHVRRRLERDRFLQPLGDAADVDRCTKPVERADPMGEMARAERVELLRRAVLTLPVKYREVLVLCDLQEMHYAEAAAVLGCAVGTIRSRLHRSRALLASRMRAAADCRDQVRLRHMGCFA